MTNLCSIVTIITALRLSSNVKCEDVQPTFKYVTSYNREGRYMTVADIEKTSVNVLRPIIFVIDGLTDEDKGGDSWSTDLKNEYVEKQISNVFLVDWNLTSPSSSASINKARSVGVAVADFIATIFNKTGESYLDIHLVGVSLGYEAAVSTAARLLEFSGRKINRVTGLDPAYYSINDETRPNRLLGEQAQFVDVVHTNLNRTNGLEPVGSVDFYADGVGDVCNTQAPLNCGPLKSAILFAKSINSNAIKARKCDSLEDFRNGICDNTEQITFGENTDKTSRGKYFLKY